MPACMHEHAQYNLNMNKHIIIISCNDLLWFFFTSTYKLACILLLIIYCYSVRQETLVRFLIGQFGEFGIDRQIILSRVNNKEGKRVSNALYTQYKMFSESHTPGIQKLTNESA